MSNIIFVYTNPGLKGVHRARPASKVKDGGLIFVKDTWVVGYYGVDDCGGQL